MKKIFEYRVFDILKDKDNSDFLDKVKKENPDQYTRFLNLVGNKGLEKAKEMYQEFDPEHIALKKKEEKEKQLELKRLRTKEGKIEYNQKIRTDYASKISDIEYEVDYSFLKKLHFIIQKYKNISGYLESAKSKKSYTSIADKELKKKPGTIKYRTLWTIDQLTYKMNQYSFYMESSASNLINIIHYFNIDTKLTTYSITFGLPSTLNDEYHPKFDSNKDEKYLNGRNNTINEKLKKYNVDQEEILNILSKLNYLLSDECYERWKLNQAVNKYNL